MWGPRALVPTPEHACAHLGAAAQVPNGAAGFYLLGRIYQLSNRHSAAIAYYNTALGLDPTMWSAYEELCALGADQEAQQFVGAGGAAARATGTGLAGSSGAAAAAAARAPSPASLLPGVATPAGSGYGASGHSGSPSSAMPAATAGARAGGLGGMFGWMDSGRQHKGAASVPRVRGVRWDRAAAAGGVCQACCASMSDTARCARAGCC